LAITQVLCLNLYRLHDLEDLVFIHNKFS